MLFTNKGKAYTLRIFEIPDLGRTAKGLPLVNLIQLGPNELVTSVLTRDPKGKVNEGKSTVEAKEEETTREYKYLLMATEGCNKENRTIRICQDQSKWINSN